VRLHLTARLEGSTVINGLGSGDIDAIRTEETDADGGVVYSLTYAALATMLREVADSLDLATEGQTFTIIGERVEVTPTPDLPAEEPSNG